MIILWILYESKLSLQQAINLIICQSNQIICDMQVSKQEAMLSFEIICDKVFYQRLECLQEDESIKIFLFPFKNLVKKTLNFAVVDMKRCKSTQDVKKFNMQEFVLTCQQMYAGSQFNEVLSYVFSKQSIRQLLSGNEKVRIPNPQNFHQVNELLKNCAIVTLRLPFGFYEDQDCNYTLEGYKFNPIGKIRQGWSYLSNGRITKGISAKPNQNEKIKRQLNQHTKYSKNQLQTILSQIQNVITLTNPQDKRSRVFEELSILGQNFCHSDKFIKTSNALIPVINFEIELLCSVFRGETCKNKIGSQMIKTSPAIVQHVCINFLEGINQCETVIKSKVESIIVKGREESLNVNAINYLHLTNMPTKIANPHLFLKTQFKEKYQQFYTKGLYEYYHYGDHNFNDQGWGCAYRSLETLLSWFRLQQKLNLLTVPTVPEIQNLIDLIDCTSQQKLTNTNTWIGATEVSWVVKKLTGNDCRIIHIKDGKDIVEHAQIFRDHLENVGTPIMYGGGEYAYSIVGINYSWKLGEIMFLILDPHYNGSDKVEKIIEKKGVCWRKPEEMFKKGVFYNFCLPIL